MVYSLVREPTGSYQWSNRFPHTSRKVTNEWIRPSHNRKCDIEETNICCDINADLLLHKQRPSIQTPLPGPRESEQSLRQGCPASTWLASAHSTLFQSYVYAIGESYIHAEHIFITKKMFFLLPLPRRKLPSKFCCGRHVNHKKQRSRHDYVRVPTATYNFLS